MMRLPPFRYFAPRNLADVRRGRAARSAHRAIRSDHVITIVSGALRVVPDSGG